MDGRLRHSLERYRKLAVWAAARLPPRRHPVRARGRRPGGAAGRPGRGAGGGQTLRGPGRWRSVGIPWSWITDSVSIRSWFTWTESMSWPGKRLHADRRWVASEIRAVQPVRTCIGRYMSAGWPLTRRCGPGAISWKFVPAPGFSYPAIQRSPRPARRSLRRVKPVCPRTTSRRDRAGLRAMKPSHTPSASPPGDAA